eukprot:TRINITY_DN2673_c0_g1_i2.p1 TRINITY_DN2673_c0_g1~~TRINITY_DN2673_c0_g1_i2.p1  ORF type:complete len:131 (+),score=6.33 TRINITY_DN2673_c0_g1_i2:52-444(+)
MKNQIMCAFIILLLEYVFGQYPSDLSELEKSIMQEIDSLNVLIYVDSSDRDCNEIVSILKSYNIIEMKVVAVDIAGIFYFFIFYFFIIFSLEIFFSFSLKFINFQVYLLTNKNKSKQLHLNQKYKKMNRR